VATKMDKRKLEYMEKLNSIYKVVLQSSPKGISAIDIAKQLIKEKQLKTTPEKYRTTVHRYLNTLELMGKVYSQKGLWFAKEVEGKPPLAVVPEYLIKRFWEEEKMIEAALLEGEYNVGYNVALNLVLKFPSPYKEKLLTETFKPVTEELKEISKIEDPFKRVLVRGRFLGGSAIPKIIEDVSKTLYEMSGVSQP
jgi:hypothetical protein